MTTTEKTAVLNFVTMFIKTQPSYSIKVNLADRLQEWMDAPDGMEETLTIMRGLSVNKKVPSG